MRAFFRHTRRYAPLSAEPYWRGIRIAPRVVAPAVSLLIIILASLIVAAPSGAKNKKTAKQPAGEHVVYMAKDYIDSTILRAIFIINDAASVAGIGFRTKESLNEAWRIARRIKKEAKGDPNETYALWKVNELEWLIRLEERDLMIQQMKESQATVNQIIDEYNTEVGKSRPDFKKLMRMHTRMLEWNTQQANAMATSINNRVRAMSREAVMGLEKALLSRNSARADKEYKYLLRNRRYLKLSHRAFEDLEDRASACIRARDELPTVKTETRKASDLVRQVKLTDARNMLALAQYRFSDIRNYISDGEVSDLTMGINEAERLLGRKEDSLVNINLSILSKKGVNAANNYLQHVVREKGVCREKAARVDQAILAVASPERKSKMAREINAVATAVENTPENDIIGEMRAKAAKKAQRKLDSLRMLDEARTRKEQKRRDSIEAVARKAATEEYRKNADLSVKTASKIYDLIERNKSRVAFDMFVTKKALLRRYLAPDAYATLESRVKKSSDASWDNTGEQIFYLMPDSKSASASTAAGAKTASADAKKERAMAIITEIYGMLNRNQESEAQDRFNREKAFLKTYLDKEAFEMLSATVDQAAR